MAVEPIEMEQSQAEETAVIQQLEPADMVQVSRSQLQALMQRQHDFEIMVTQSVEIALMIQGVFGGRVPKSVPDALGMLPKVWKQFSSNPEILIEIEKRIQVIRDIAPRYLPAETVAKLDSFIAGKK